MGTTTLLGIEFPDEYLNPHFSEIVAFFNGSAEWIHSNVEDKTLDVVGDFSFNSSTGELSWASPITLRSMISNGVITINAGSIIIPDGQIAYVTASSRPISTETLTVSVGSAPILDRMIIKFAARVGDEIFINNRGSMSVFAHGDTHVDGTDDIPVVTTSVKGLMSSSDKTKLDSVTADMIAALAGTSGSPSDSNRYVTNNDSRLSDSRTPIAHAIGGALHTSSTLAALSGLVSDDNIVGTSRIGAISGVCDLDGAGKVPLSRLPDAILGGLYYAGTWNAATNTPTLTSGSGDDGAIYIVNVEGTTNLDGITDWKVGDQAVYSDVTGAWGKIDNTDQVVSVFGRQGVVTAQSGDYTADQVTNAFDTSSDTSDSIIEGVSQLFMSVVQEQKLDALIIRDGNVVGGTLDFTDGNISGINTGINGGSAVSLSVFRNAIMTNGSVIDERTAPPKYFYEGDRFLVAPSATGDWLQHDGEIAQAIGVSSNYSEWISQREVHIGYAAHGALCWSPELEIFVSLHTNATSSKVAVSKNGRDWEVYDAAANNTWQGLCWSPELMLFVATATSGTGNRVMTSPDGKNWTIRTTTQDTPWWDVTWSRKLKLFCAISDAGTSRVMTSPDGITWTLRTSSAAVLSGVCWSESLGIFCATGTGPLGLISSDGITWTDVTLPDAYWNEVCWSEKLQLFCAVATFGDAQVVTSPDGINWTARTPASASYWSTVCWAPELELFCSVAFNGYPNQIMTSPDGINWTLQSNAGAGDYFYLKVVWSGKLGIFCAVPNNDVSDGIMISQVNCQWVFKEPEVGDHIHNMFSGVDYDCYNYGLKKSFRETIEGTMSVPAGATIDQTYFDIPINGLLPIITEDNHNIDYEIRMSVGRGSYGALAKLYAKISSQNPGPDDFDIRYDTITGNAYTDITAWSAEIIVPDGAWADCCYAPELDLFIAVGATNTEFCIAKSHDGKKWEPVRAPIISTLSSVCWSSDLNLFCAVSKSGTGNRVMTSPDGDTWTVRTSAADLMWESVVWGSGAGVFVAVAWTGTGNRVMTSPDGITWTSRTSAGDYSWQSVAWSESLTLFVAVSSTYSGGYLSQIMTSPDGITWTLRTAATLEGLQAVCWSETLGLFAAVSQTGSANRAQTSPDGINWTARTTPDRAYSDICYSEDLALFVAVFPQSSGTAAEMTSSDGITWTEGNAYEGWWSSVFAADGRGIVIALTSSTGMAMILDEDLDWELYKTCGTYGSSLLRMFIQREETTLFANTYHWVAEVEGNISEDGAYYCP